LNGSKFASGIRIVKLDKTVNMKNWIFVAFLLSFSCVFAQPETAQTEVIGGKKYYIHFVQTGNTLWGIHDMYNVSVEEIIKYNPGTEKGLTDGQKLILPVQLQTVKHTVESKETLFAISKKYDVSVESIIAKNPTAEIGIKVGQVLTISGVEKKIITTENVPITNVQNEKAQTTDPVIEDAVKYKISFKDTMIQHVILDHETLYSISKRYMVSLEELQSFNGLKSSKIKPGDVLRIPIKKEKIQLLEKREVKTIVLKTVDTTLLFPKKSQYKIAIILPFNLEKGSTDYVATLATEFYMGAKLAIDSLEKMGLEAQVFIYDTKTDTISLKKILEKPEFSGIDLVFGPLSADNIDVVARWCKANKARMICPVSANVSVIKNNPFIYNAVPSDATLMKGFAEFTLNKNSKDQVIIIKSTNEKDLIMYESFRNTFLTFPFVGVRPKLIEATMDNYLSFMRKGVNNILVFPTNEKSLAVKFMNNLSTSSSKFNDENIFVYATKDWVNFDDVKPHYKNKYNFHYASPNDLNYKYSKTEQLHRKYRANYNADMTKMSVQGFDVLFYFTSNLLLNKKENEMIMNQFEMKQNGIENGFENSKVYIIEQENFELINVQKK
jgi:LysM repeat protein